MGVTTLFSVILKGLFPFSHDLGGVLGPFKFFLFGISVRFLGAFSLQSGIDDH